VGYEADDALGTAVRHFKDSAAAEQFVICSPDKDLAQLVSGRRIVCWDRRRDTVLDEVGVLEKFGVLPLSIPDWLALVGDSADGYPGIPGWGAKSASAVLSRFAHLESIPEDAQEWGLGSTRAARLRESLVQHHQEALLYRQLATLRQDVPLQETLDDLEWRGAREELKELCYRMGDEQIPMRVPRWR
jgi:5'-3' exonuclease